MSGADLELDVQMSELEVEWRRAYEASIAARSDYQGLAGHGAGADLMDAAKERLDRAEALKSRVMARIERLEHRLLGDRSVG